MTPFVADLRYKAAATCILAVISPFGPTLFLDIEGILTNNINDVERHPHPMHALRWEGIWEKIGLKDLLERRQRD